MFLAFDFGLVCSVFHEIPLFTSKTTILLWQACKHFAVLRDEAKKLRSSVRAYDRGLWDIVLSYIWFCISRAKGMSKAWDGFLQILGVYWLDIQIGFV